MFSSGSLKFRSSSAKCLKALVGEIQPSPKYSMQTKENNKKSPAKILPYDDKNDSTNG